MVGVGRGRAGGGVVSAAERRRGADAERAVVNYLRAAGWPDTRRYLAGDGRQPGDIDGAGSAAGMVHK